MANSPSPLCKLSPGQWSVVSMASIVPSHYLIQALLAASCPSVSSSQPPQSPISLCPEVSVHHPASVLTALWLGT